MTNKRGVAEMAILTLQCRDRTIDAMFLAGQYQNAKRNFFSKTGHCIVWGSKKRKPSEDDDFEKTTIKKVIGSLNLPKSASYKVIKIFIHLKEKDLKEETG